MKRTILALALALPLLTGTAFAHGSGGHGGGHSGGHHSGSKSHKSKSSKSSSGHTNPDIVHVEGYTKKNGKHVKSHDRTAPNSTDLDNWSTVGNVNPETGKKGTKKHKH